MMTFRPGMVVRYVPIATYPGGDSRHCREGMAIANDRGVLVDTFWNSTGDSHCVTEAEQASVFIVGDLADYDHVDHRWYPGAEAYHPDDRMVVTHQHGLQRDQYVRKGATPHLGTQIRRQVEKVREAERTAASAVRDVEWQRRRLAELLTQRAERVTS